VLRDNRDFLFFEIKFIAKALHGNAVRFIGIGHGNQGACGS
jgi:hypothetical protein